MLRLLPSFFANHFADDKGRRFADPFIELQTMAVEDTLQRATDIMKIMNIDECPNVLKEMYKAFEINGVRVPIDKSIIHIGELYVDPKFQALYNKPFRLKHDVFNETRFIEFDEKPPYTLYAKEVVIDTYPVIEFYGKLLGYTPAIKQYSNIIQNGIYPLDYEYIDVQLKAARREIFALLYIRMKGATQDNLTNFISAVLGYPTAPMDGVITELTQNSITIDTNGVVNTFYVSGPTNSKFHLGYNLKKFEGLCDPPVYVYDFYSDPARFIQTLLANKSEALVGLLNIDREKLEDYAALFWDSELSFDQTPEIYYEMGDHRLLENLPNVPPSPAYKLPVNTNQVASDFTDFKDNRFTSVPTYSITEMFSGVTIIESHDKKHNDKLNAFLPMVKQTFTKFLTFYMDENAHLRVFTISFLQLAPIFQFDDWPKDITVTKTDDYRLYIPKLTSTDGKCGVYRWFDEEDHCYEADAIHSIVVDRDRKFFAEWSIVKKDALTDPIDIGDICDIGDITTEYFFASYTSETKYIGMVYAGDNLAVAIRYNMLGQDNYNFQLIDLEGETPLVTSVNVDKGRSCRGGCYVGEGVVLAVANAPVLINTRTKQAVSIAEDYSTPDKYWGATYNENGTATLIPYGGKHAAVIDVEAKTITTFGNLDGANSNGGHYAGGVYIGNGKTVAIPLDTPRPAIIDAYKKTITQFGVVNNNLSKYRGGVYLGNGLVLAIPFGESRPLLIDGELGTTTELSEIANDYYTNNMRFCGGVYVGKPLAIPFSYPQSALIDTESTRYCGDYNVNKFKYAGGAFVGNGRVLLAPYQATQFALMDFHMTKPRQLTEQELLGTWFNKF